MDFHPLDRPVWSALTTRQGEFAVGDEGGACEHDAVDANPGSLILARANYIGMFGTNSWEAHELEEGEVDHHGEGEPFAGNGMFFANSRMPFRHVTDGLSKTIFMGEILADCHDRRLDPEQVAGVGLGIWMAR